MKIHLSLKGFFVASALCLASHFSSAKILIVSDIDDTLKLANINDLDRSISYAFDSLSSFAGMSTLYNALSIEQSTAEFYYLSNAPAWLMESTHRSFLANNSFPIGTYLPRTTLFSGDHKTRELRRLIREIDPDTVILFGDNGERDPLIYEKIQNEFSGKGIQFFVFIRWVYSPRSEGGPGQNRISSQYSFVTPFEIASILFQKNLISQNTLENVMTETIELLQKSGSDRSGSVLFPYFVKCSDYKWEYDWTFADFPQAMNIRKGIDSHCALPPQRKTDTPIPEWNVSP